MRLVLALVFLTASYGKLTGGIEMFPTAFNLPVWMGWLVALGELGAGIGIIVGAFLEKQDPKGMLTRLSGGIIALIMLGAIILVKSKGFEAGFLPGIGGMYPDIALLALGLNFALMGNTGAVCEMCKK